MTHNTQTVQITLSHENTPDPTGKIIEIKVGQELRAIGIPPRPNVLLQIDAEMQKNEPDFTHLADIISEDVALSAGLIKVANSSYFGFSKAVRSVQESLLVLGLNTIIHAISGMQLQKAFQNVRRLERFWHASATTAHTSAWIAHQIKSKTVRPVDAYTFGLFHDCGIPLLMAPFPEYVSILEEANAASGQSFTDVENSHLTINHATVGAELATEWLLPPELCLAIQHHHNGDAIAGHLNLSRRSRDVIAIAQMAEHFLNFHTGLSKSCEWEKLGDMCLSTLDIDAAQLALLYAGSIDVINRE